MDRFSLKDLAAKAQSAGNKIAQQVKEQQQKFVQRSGEASGNDEDMENALRLLQIQNRGLRDRLRATAEENEKLQEELHQMAARTPKASSSQDLPTAPTPESSVLLSSTVSTSSSQGVGAVTPTPRLASVLAENEMLKEQLARVQAEQTKLHNEVDNLKSELEKTSSTAAADAAHQATRQARVLETLKGELSVAQAAREAAEMSSQHANEEIQRLSDTVAALQQEHHHQRLQEEEEQVAAVRATVENLKKENEALQVSLRQAQDEKGAEVEEVTRQLTEARADLESQRAQHKALIESVEVEMAALVRKHEDLSNELATMTSKTRDQGKQESLAAAAIAAEQSRSKEIEEILKAREQRIQVLEEEIAAQKTWATKKEKEEVDEKERWRNEVQALEHELASVRQGVDARVASETSVLQVELDQLHIQVLAAEEAAKEAKKTHELEEELSLKDITMVASPDETAAAVAAVAAAAAVEVKEKELAQQHQGALDKLEAAYASQMRALEAEIVCVKEACARAVEEARVQGQEERTDLESRRLGEQETAAHRIAELEGALKLGQEQIESLEQRVGEVQSEKAAAVEALRAELETQHAQHAASLESMQEQVDTLRADHGAEADALHQQIAALQAKLTEADASVAAASAASREEAEWLQEGAQELQRQLDAARAELQSAEEGRKNAIEEKESTLQTLQDALKKRGAAEEAEPPPPPPPPPPPSYEDVQLKDAVERLRVDLATARQEATYALERALASETVHQEAVDALTVAKKAAMEESARLHADIEAAHERIEELEEKVRLLGSAPRPPPPPPPPPPQHTPQTAISSPTTTTSPGGLVPLHRRDPSYSSEIEPLSPEQDTSNNNGGAVAEKKENETEHQGEVESRHTSSPPPPPLPILHPGLHLSVEDRLKALELELKDSERTHVLRDTATAVLKEEIAELRRQNKRADVDVEYLKAVLVESFASGELSASSHMLPVLARLLHFSGEDMQRAMGGGSSARKRLGGGASGASDASLAGLSSAVTAAASQLFAGWTASSSQTGTNANATNSSSHE